MARTTKPLTNTEVQQAKPKDKIYTLSDGDGLQLRIKPNGTKLWLFDYLRPYTKKRTCLRFGSFPELSLAEARGKRNAARELLTKGIDPKEHREETNRLNKTAHSNTLEHIAAKWLEVKKAKVSIDHAKGSLETVKRLCQRLNEIDLCCQYRFSKSTSRHWQSLSKTRKTTLANP